MEATYFYEKLVGFQRTIRRYIPEDTTLPNHRCENLKSYKSNYLLIMRYLPTGVSSFFEVMTAKKFMIGGGSVYHEASSPDSGYDMEMSLLGLKMETEDQENLDEDDDDEEDDECEDNFGDMNEINKAKEIKCKDEVSNMITEKRGDRKHDGHASNGSGSRKKRYSRARTSRARSPTQVK
jgi:hypothetical protein